jgi:hypothetical protein
VVKADIAEWFSAIPHYRLMQLVEERLVDQPRPLAAGEVLPQRVVFWLHLHFCFPRKRLTEMLPNGA